MVYFYWLCTGFSLWSSDLRIWHHWENGQLFHPCILPKMTANSKMKWAEHLGLKKQKSQSFYQQNELIQEQRRNCNLGRANLGKAETRLENTREGQGRSWAGLFCCVQVVMASHWLSVAVSHWLGIEKSFLLLGYVKQVSFSWGMWSMLLSLSCSARERPLQGFLTPF